MSIVLGDACIGDGYNSLSGALHRGALHIPEQAIGTEPLSDSHFHAEFIHDKAQSQNRFAASASATVPVAAHAGINLGASFGIDSFREAGADELLFVIRFHRWERSKLVREFRFPENMNERLLHSWETFFEQAGNRFVSEVISGRMYKAAIRFRFNSDAEKREFSNSVNVGNVNFASVATLFNHVRNTENIRINCEVETFQKGLNIAPPPHMGNLKQLIDWISGIGLTCTNAHENVLSPRPAQLYSIASPYSQIVGTDRQTLLQLEDAIKYKKDYLQIIARMSERAERLKSYIEDTNLVRRKPVEYRTASEALAALNIMKGQIEHNRIAEVIGVISQFKREGIRLEGSNPPVRLNLGQILNNLNQASHTVNKFVIIYKSSDLRRRNSDRAAYKKKIKHSLYRKYQSLTLEPLDHYGDKVITIRYKTNGDKKTLRDLASCPGSLAFYSAATGVLDTNQHPDHLHNRTPYILVTRRSPDQKINREDGQDIARLTLGLAAPPAITENLIINMPPRPRARAR